MFFRPAQWIVALAGVVAMTAAVWPASASDISEVGDILSNEGFVTLPLRRGGDDQVEVGGKVQVNGIRGRFLIDTGAQVSVIDRRSVRHFRLTSEKTGTRVYGALGGRGERLRAALAMSFVVGPADMRPFIFGVADLGPLNESRESGEGDFNGIIGIDVLRTYQFVVDYRGMRLFVRVDDPKNAGRSNLSGILRRQGYTEIPLSRFVYSDFEFRAKINETDFVMLLDSGASVTLLDRRQALGAGLRLQTTDVSIGGAGGTRQRLSLARAESFRAGGFRTGPFQVGVSDLSNLNTQFAQAGRPALGGYLGSDFLRAKNAIIDCANMRLYLRD